jgi:hypothetical protein
MKAVEHLSLIAQKKGYITSESNTFLLLTIYFSRAFEKQYISVTVQVETCATISTVLDIKAWTRTRIYSISPSAHKIRNLPLFSWKSNIEWFNAAQSIAALYNQAWCGKSTVLEIGPSRKRLHDQLTVHPGSRNHQPRRIAFVERKQFGFQLYLY